MQEGTQDLDETKRVAQEKDMHSERTRGRKGMLDLQD
jgi:hypothetical protein